MGVLGVAVVTDFDTGIVEITARGVLDASTVPVMRGAVIKATAEDPNSIVVDLNDTAITSNDVAAVFISLAGRLSERMIGLAVYAGPGDTADVLHRVLAGCVPVRDDRSGAIAALADSNERYRRLHMHLMPVPRAAAQARALVDLACTNWGLDIDRDVARLVVTELVTNSVKHAGTDVDVSIIWAGAHLIIEVRDRSTIMPGMATDAPGTNLSKGWGLTLVDATVTSWGFHATATGKTVWATLRLRAPGHHHVPTMEAMGTEAPSPPVPVGGRPPSESMDSDIARMTPGQIWRQARKAAGLAATMLSPLTIRCTAARKAIYAALLTDPRRPWAVNDVLDAIPAVHRPASETVRSTIYVLLDDGVMERVPFHPVLTARLSPEGARLLRALLWKWEREEQDPPSAPGPA